MLAPWPHHSSDASNCVITSVTGGRNARTDAVKGIAEQPAGNAGSPGNKRFSADKEVRKMSLDSN